MFFKTFYKSIIIVLLLVLLFILQGCQADTALEGISAEKAGFSSDKLKRVSLYAEEIGTSAVIALYDGKVFYSWGNVSRNSPCHSIRKPLLGALYGIHIDRGLININSTLNEISIDDIPPELTQKEKSATIKDLLMSRSGIYHKAAAESNKMKQLRPDRGSFPPGEFFYYNNWDFNALGTIFENITGEKIFNSFKKEIAEQIGMEDFSPLNCRYYYEKNLSEHPAYIFQISAKDLARFGLLYMNSGLWNHHQIISEHWISESTKGYSDNPMNGDKYGYLWSIIPETVFPGGGYYHTGFNNHFLGILPEEKLVVVHRGEGNPEIKQDAGKMRKLLFMFFDAKK